MFMGFFIGFADRPALVARCVGFVVFLCFLYYAHGLLIGFADRPPLAPICVVFLFSCVSDAMSMCF